MANILLKPYDSVDLGLLVESYGESIGTVYPQAVVYGPDNIQISGSPFNLSLIGNNFYSLKNAFQAAIDSGQYSVIYIVYTDAGHTTRSSSHGEKIDTITISVQAVSGGVGNAGGFYYDDEPLRKSFKQELDKILKKIKKLQDDFDAGLKIEIPDNQIQISRLEHSLKDIKNSMPVFNDGNLIKQIAVVQSSLKNKADDLMSAIKKNRTTIIKNKFDKSLMIPIMKSLADNEMKIANLFNEVKIDFTKTIDYKNDKMADKFTEILEKFGGNITKSMNDLNESIRTKLKFTIDWLKKLVLWGRPPKQNINITVTKDEI
jgi:hypothetical protein